MPPRRRGTHGAALIFENVGYPLTAVAPAPVSSSASSLPRPLLTRTLAAASGSALDTRIADLPARADFPACNAKLAVAQPWR